MNYASKFPPYAHQEEALKRLSGRQAYALFMAMRTGKTKVILDDYGRLELEGKVQDLIVIAPGGVYRTWEHAIEDHLSDDLRSRAFIHVWKGGDTKTEKVLLENLLCFDGPRIFIMNIEAVARVKRLRGIMDRFVASGRKIYAAIDESTIIKNESAGQTEAVMAYQRFFRYRRILSGLPTPQSPLDLYSQFKFLDESILGFRSFFSFRARFCVLRKVNFNPKDPNDPTGQARTGKSTTIVVAHRDPEELSARIDPFRFRVRLEDCYDMPKKIYMVRDVELTPDQVRIYKELKTYATAELEKLSHITAVNVISKLIKMHQVLLGHATDEMGVVKEFHEFRTKALLELLQEFDGKAIIWCSYHIDIVKVRRALRKEYGPLSVATFYGGNVSHREDDERRFQHDPECRFMVSTAAAGGRGRTWDNASMLVYYSNTDNLEHRMQSEERAEAIGKIASTLIIDLWSRGTVEDKIIKSMREKLNMSSIINGDNYKEWLI